MSIYHACDVFYSAFIPCVADYSWSFSLLHGSLVAVTFMWVLVWY